MNSAVPVDAPPMQQASPANESETPPATATLPEMLWRDEDARARKRWAICFAVVIALHAGPAVFAALWIPSADPRAAPPSSAIMIQLAPMPAAPPAPPTEIPPGPKQQRVEKPKPQQPVRKAKPKPKVEPVRKAAVPLPTQQEPERPHTETKPPVAQTTAPPSAVAPPAPAAAPAVSAPAEAAMTAPNWQGLLLGRLEQFKRYPDEAQARRQQGVAYLRFVMDRNGKVLSFRIEKSSGYDLLDKEALALIQRAQPLPKPPASVPGDRLELVVPVEFFLNGRK